MSTDYSILSPTFSMILQKYINHDKLYQSVKTKMFF